MNKINIVPYPKKVIGCNNNFLINESYTIVIPTDNNEKIMPVAERLKKIIYEEMNLDLMICVGNVGNSNQIITFINCSLMPPEAYNIYITGKQLIIEYSNEAGAFYATSTMKQVLKSHSKIPFNRIEDAPDYKVRGVMLDISRNKIPTMDTLFGLIDFLADLKINQLQLYVEGFSFAYPSFPQVWQNGTPITSEEITQLDRYCQERMIELVPNQNSFGHMTSWLELEEYKNLAESSSGFVNAIGLYEHPGTLNPLDPKSLTLIEKLYDDFLPNFTSKLFNAGCDEPFDLGKGKSRQACEKYGKGRVYIDFLKKINSLVRKKGRKMMFWGDIIINYPELICEIPTDTIVLEWGYEDDHPFYEHCKRYMDAGLPFYVCPGTSSWKSISGKTQNMKNNLENAALNGKKLGAEGFIITDWGDYGHWQYLPVSYSGFVYGAALSWNVKENIGIDIGSYLDKFIFLDKSKLTSKILNDLGNYYLLENGKTFNSTVTANTLLVDIYNMKPLEGQSLNVFRSIEDYVSEIKSGLDLILAECKDSALIKKELQNTCRLIIHGTKLAKLKYMIASGEIPPKDFVSEMINEIDIIINYHKELWLERNRPGGLDESVAQMDKLKNQYNDILAGRRTGDELRM